ncbi:hypothetical protein C9J48_07855 [Photobacterium profundum]|uniref:Uncharacterized protein n=1 Tax=Photobacterium profundum 3TCK TaxID=314280 RepID=Q1ZAN3_9GAMM|nr:hypothetical protein [Photobacterium profundum]EAS45459.1 hypothetical protein P3TCK_03761 [Photobacterium profundum 3TCK]PSV63362.1 hypothetical protein C9J48_07855 [Photobacterium profundum]
MPLLACPTCEKLISKRAHSCPQCGEPDPFNYYSRKSWIERLVWTVVIVAIVAFSWQVLFPMLIEAVR